MALRAKLAVTVTLASTAISVRVAFKKPSLQFTK